MFDSRNSNYRILFNADEKILTVELRGFWDMAIMNRYREDLLIAIRRAVARHGQFAILSHSEEFPVQSAEVAQAFGELTIAASTHHNGPTAILVGSVMNKKQVDRVFQLPNLRVFVDEGEARDWIRSQLDGG